MIMWIRNYTTFIQGEYYEFFKPQETVQRFQWPSKEG